MRTSSAISLKSRRRRRRAGDVFEKEEGNDGEGIEDGGDEARESQ